MTSPLFLTANHHSSSFVSIQFLCARFFFLRSPKSKREKRKSIMNSRANRTVLESESRKKSDTVRAFRLRSNGSEDMKGNEGPHE